MMTRFSLRSLEKLSLESVKPFAYVVGLAFLGALVVSAAASWYFLPGNKIQLPKAAAPETQVKIDTKKRDLGHTMSVIVDRNLFNSDEEKSTKTEEEEIPADRIVKSSLPLKLMGTIFGGDTKVGLALIQNSSKNTINSFMKGDLLMKGAVLEEIFRNKIHIKREGRIEFIEIEKKEKKGRRKSKGGSKALPKSTPGKVAPLATAPPPKEFSMDGFERKGSSSTISRGLKDTLLTRDISKILQDAKAVPYLEGGELKGFRLTRIREGSVYQMLGFQNDDVVIEINGVALNNAGRAIQLLNSLRNETNLDIRVLRGGSEFDMSVTVQ